MPEKKKVLLVGSSGRVGRLVCRAFDLNDANNFHIVAQYRQRLPLVQFHPGSIERKQVQWDAIVNPAIPRALEGQDFAAMILLAGITPKSPGNLDENAIVAKAWLDAALRLGIPKTLIASTSSVYGLGNGVPISESSPLEPVTHYGKAKLAMEQAVEHYRDRMAVCCLRIGNVLGADAVMLNGRAASHEKPLLLDQFANGGGPVRSYIDPMTLSEVLMTLVEHNDLPDALNVACPQPAAMQSLIEAAHIPWQWRPADPKANKILVLDCQALHQIHRFDENASEPTILVRRLKRVTDSISDDAK